MIAALCTFLAVLAAPTLGNDTEYSTLISPCPDVFMYEPPGPELNRWYGVFKVTTDNLDSLRLDIVLDNKADILGNWIGEVTTLDNTNYTILTDVHNNSTPIVEVRFFVKYNRLKKVPRLEAIRLNGREICSNVRDPGTTVRRPPYIRPSETDYDDVYFPGGHFIDSALEILQKKYPASENLNLQHTCGKVILNKERRINLNSTDTLEGHWPWHVAIYQDQTVDSKYICGGTLVSKHHVITAAHCVTRTKSTKNVNKNSLRVYLGKHNLMNSVEGVQVKFVNKILVFPEYNATTFRNDLAILELRNTVTYTNTVQPVCLWPEKETDLQNILGKTGSIVGWGHDATGVVRSELTHRQMAVVNQETCVGSYPDFFKLYTFDSTYCAGYQNHSTTCNGDSGGGMVFQKGDSWYLRGVVSVSVVRQETDGCDPNHYVIFTDVAKFHSWIHNYIAD